MAEDDHVRVGVGLLILKDGKVLIGKRTSSFGAGEYASVGGHVEYGETLEEAILRELAEECGVQVKNLRMLCVTDLFKYAPRHYVDVSFVAEWASGEPQVLEPEKRESWEWRDMADLPDNLFGTLPQCIEAYKTGKSYFTVQ